MPRRRCVLSAAAAVGVLLGGGWGSPSARAGAGPLDVHLAHLRSKVGPNPKLAMFGLYSPSQWAGLDSMQPPAAEVSYLLRCLSSPQTAYANGPSLLGIKYMTVRADEVYLIAQKNADALIAGRGLQQFTVCQFKQTDISTSAVLAAMAAHLDYMRSLNF